MPPKRRGRSQDPSKHEAARPSNYPQSTSTLPFFRTGIIVISLFALLVGIYKYRNDTRSIPIHVGHKSEADLFVVVDLPGKGKGIIASRDIKQGELIIREQPLFVVPREISVSPAPLIRHSLRQLTDTGREAFYNLSYVNFPQDRDPDDYPEELALAIFQTNAVAAGQNVGLFPMMARLNHGCSKAFNVVYSWREHEGRLVVHALKDIEKGQELLTTYTNTKRPRRERREYLSQVYGFHCTCDVCSLPEAESLASDSRLTSMTELYEQFATWGQNQITGLQAIEIVHKIWALGEEEGYWSGRGTLAADAAWVAAAHSDALATRDWARLAMKWYTYELGNDSEQMQTMRAILSRPESHFAWGTREPMDVKGPLIDHDDKS